jgi:hypothetical protein
LLILSAATSPLRGGAKKPLGEGYQEIRSPADLERLVGLRQVYAIAVPKVPPIPQLLWHSEPPFIGYNTA